MKRTEDAVGADAIGNEIAEAGQGVETGERIDVEDLSGLSPDELVDDIRRNISCIAHCHARVLALIDEADRRELWGQWVGVTSLANWVMHIAAVGPHTAREYVRVMTALRQMPLVRQSLHDGNVSYSKVREITRLAGSIPDEDALRLAEHATGSQIGVVVRNYRQLGVADDYGSVPRELPADSVTMRSTVPGRTRIVIDLSEDDAAEFLAMLEAARHVLEGQDHEPGSEGSRDPVSQVMCLMEIVQAFPQEVPSGSLSADRARMLVHVSAEVVTGSAAGVPAGTPADASCRIDGFGGIAAATAERLACEALISGVIKDGGGDVLSLGRSRRLVSKRQRLALSARDVGCQFPGCRTRRRCDAHHVRPWSQGGPTDMDNLVLLCRTHHTVVHEYSLTIRRTDEPFSGTLSGGAAFAFFMPDGSELLPLGDEWRAVRAFDTARLVKAAEGAITDADPSTRGAGEGFSLERCLEWMFEAEGRRARADNVAA